ncbi:MAG: FMN-binding negative transcriptional regulator [Pseudomonadota bacterium]
MHPNPAFRGQPETEAAAMARHRGFGVLTASTAEGPLAAHVPFLLAEDATALEAHLVRSNPLARALRDGPLPAMMIVSGADAYVSPDWYGEDDKVPTWNYVAVHVRGTLALSTMDLRGHLDRVSAHFEGQLAGKTPWKTDKMSADALQKMMRQILPVEMRVDSIASTVKLNQNRSDAARHGAAAAIAAGGTPGLQTVEIAAMMRALDD